MKRFKSVKKASILGVLGNLFLFILKIIVGLISSSQAMLADAFNSASDILSSIMTFIGNKIASMEADDDHNLGHGKAEYIYSMLISIMMIGLGFKIFFDSLISLFITKNFIFTKWLIIVCLITIIVKFCLYIYTKNISKKYNNLLIKANSQDHRNDIILTTFNLISALCAASGIYIIDSIVGILISIWIILTGLKIYKASYDVLMDKTISNKTKDQVLAIISHHQEIKKITHFNATPVGYLYQVSFSIFVDGNLSTFASHEIANNLEKEIGQKVPEIYLTVIHVNPIEPSENSDN